MSWIAGAVMCLTIGALTKTDAPVTIIYEQGHELEAREVVDYLRSQLSPTPLVETATRAVSPRDLMGRSDVESIFVLLETTRGEVTVVRPSTGTAVTRLVGAEAVRESPYAVALVATELVGIAYQRSRQKPPPPPRPPEWGVLIQAGLAISASPAQEPALLQPSAGLDAVHYGRARAWWILGGLRGRFAGSSSNELVVGAEVFDVRYARNDVEVRLGGGFSAGRVDVGLTGNFGLSFTDLEVTELRRGVVEASAAEVGVLIGGGAEARYELGWGFGLVVALEALAVPQARRYFVRDQLALEEGTFRTSATLSLSWQSAEY